MKKIEKTSDLPKSSLRAVKPVSSEEIEASLARIVQSEDFSQARRLKEFLTYVVAEAASGRGDAISARTIAQDVYQRGASENDSDLSVVRVDAGRLRRRLAAYYSADGRDDQVHVSIPVGSYAPVFERFGAVTETEEAGEQSRASGSGIKVLMLLLAGIALAVGGYVSGAFQLPATGSDTSVREAAIRQALLSKSPASLQAANQADQARALLFPALDPQRLELVGALFENVIALDETYFGGYAGAAQAYASLSVLAPSPELRAALFQRARAYSAQAISLRPESGWAQSAAAFVAFANGEFDTALATSERAISLAPGDEFVRELDALISLFAGEFERARQQATKATELNPDLKGSTAYNVAGVASFHLGQHQETIRQITTVIEKGHPISQISVFYMAAAYQALGQHENAHQMALYYQNAWPGVRVDRLLKGLYHPGVDLGAAVDLFQAALAD